MEIQELISFTTIVQQGSFSKASMIFHVRKKPLILH